MSLKSAQIQAVKGKQANLKLCVSKLMIETKLQKGNTASVKIAGMQAVREKSNIASLK